CYFFLCCFGLHCRNCFRLGCFFAYWSRRPHWTLANHVEFLLQIALMLIHRRPFGRHGEQVQFAAIDAASTEGALARVIFPLVLVPFTVHFHGAGGAAISALAATDASFGINRDHTAVIWA